MAIDALLLVEKDSQNDECCQNVITTRKTSSRLDLLNRDAVKARFEKRSTQSSRLQLAKKERRSFFPSLFGWYDALLSCLLPSYHHRLRSRSLLKLNREARNASTPQRNDEFPIAERCYRTIFVPIFDRFRSTRSRSNRLSEPHPLAVSVGKETSPT